MAAHDPRWLNIAQAERRRLADRLNLPRTSIEHIGSTAVPELVAKPIIDLMLGLERFPPTAKVIAELESLSYESLGEAGVPERMYFRRRGDESVNLHVVRLGGDHWRNNIALRELLKSEPSLRKRYETAKVRAFEAGQRTLLEYSEAKRVIIDELLSKLSGT